MDHDAFFDRPVDIVARELIGARFGHGAVSGRIVETEAYAADDPASHSYPGLTKRNSAMFLGPGHLYVYRSYGLHWCVNLVTRPGHAVLIRALEPISGIDEMIARRGDVPLRRLAAGPGNVAAALGITGALDGTRLGPPMLFAGPGTALDVVSGARIGISKGIDLPWRFGLAGSAFLSRPFPRARNGAEATRRSP